MSSGGQDQWELDKLARHTGTRVTRIGYGYYNDKLVGQEFCHRTLDSGFREAGRTTWLVSQVDATAESADLSLEGEDFVTR